MTDLHPSIADIEIPQTMSGLPRSAKGFPVPWFVAFVDGDPDFRIIKPDAVRQASKYQLCWLCGHELGMTATYVSGPMCGINRNTAEPPSHHKCADYAAKACPFLARPHARRRDIPDDVTRARDLSVPGTQIMRNPGVAMLWRTTSLTLPRHLPGERDPLFTLPDPIRVDWTREGRPATHAEVRASVESGIPLLRDEAARQGPEAMNALFHAVREFYGLMPPPTADDRARELVT